MLSKIRSEVLEIIVIVTIIFYTVAFSVTYNKEALWKGKYANWTYNTMPSEGTGFIDSIVLPENND